MDDIDKLPLRIIGLKESLLQAKGFGEINENELCESDIAENSMNCSKEYYTDSIQRDHVGVHLISIMPKRIFESDVYYTDIICAAKHIATQETERTLIHLLESKCKGLNKNIRKDWINSDFPRKKYTERAIAEILKEECCPIYFKWQSKWIDGTLAEIFEKGMIKGNSLSVKIETLTVLLYKFFWLDYIYISSDTKGWYSMDGGILTEFPGSVEDMFTRLHEKSRFWRLTYRGDRIEDSAINILDSTFHNQNFRNVFEAFMNTIGSFNVTSKNFLYKTLENKFSIKELHKDMNNDPERILWSNGKMTVATPNGIKVVKPHIEDLYNIQTGCDLPDEDDVPDEDLLELFDKWMRDVYPEGAHDFVLTDWAGFLRGGNPFKKLRCPTGQSGSNSKTSIMDMLGKVFGDYCVPANISLLMNSKDGGATTELAKSVRSRITIINETGSAQGVDAEQIKLLTGDQDLVSFRDIYTKSKSSKVYTKIIVVCNEIFKIKNADVATQRRFEVHSHLARWVTDPEQSEFKGKKYIHKIDTNFSTKIPKLATVLAWQLVYNYYPKYVEWLKDSRKRELPTLFREDQKKQWIKVCELSGFVNNYVVETGNEEDSIKIEEIITHYNFEKRRPSQENYDSLREKIIMLCFDKAHIVDDVIYGFREKKKRITQMPIAPVTSSVITHVRK